MRTMATAFAFIFIMLGIVLRFVAHLAEEAVPKLGFAAFQSAAAGSYSPDMYAMDLSGCYGLGAASIWIGILVLLLAWQDLIRLFAKHVLEESKKRGQIGGE
ncbi:hypothetical protein ACFFSY_20365 [Paenibacillus aurantiacus]|uniref:Uncharacterized protein n=1 Tax=Paenibacillus aurantiacus TaxID=1936118 RepID=A0ABV5KTV3_9BACL